MKLFHRTMQLRPGARILDVGGTPDLWTGMDWEAQITLFNRPQEFDHWRPIDLLGFAVVDGDICRERSDMRQYDVIFSNSVLEHVGSARRQQQFADVVSSGGTYWVQVPAPIFPIEVHCRMPLWWFLPTGLRRRMIWRWRRRGRLFLSRQMAGTRPIGRHRLQALFPEAHILTERWMGFPKSYYAYAIGNGASV